MKKIFPLFFIIGLALATWASAQPQQRIIVGLEAALTAEDKEILEAAVEEILSQPVRLSEASNETRWVLIVAEPLSADALKQAIAKVQALSNVRYAEPDQMFSAQ